MQFLVFSQQARVCPLPDQRLTLRMSDHPFISLEQQPCLSNRVFRFFIQRSIRSPGQDHNALEACIADPTRREMQRSLIHLNGRALWNKKGCASSTR